jgi:TPR repeat protein/nucleoside phosphorylase
MSIMKAPSQDLKGKIDFAIITIRVDEYEAFLHRLPTQVFAQGRQTYSVSQLMATDGTKYSIALVRCPEQGNTTSQTVTHNLIEDLDPQWLIVAGIAGSIPDTEHTLGDVLIATRLQDFSISACIESTTHQSSREFDVRGGPMHPSVQSLVAAIPAIEPHLERWNTPETLIVERPEVRLSANNYYGDNAWKKKVKASIEMHFGSKSERNLPKVFTGSIVSSDVLVKDTELVKQWLTTSRQLRGIEMELAGVYQAAWNAQKPVLAVRGISDIVGFKRSAEWTSYACQTAASFLVSLLRGYPPITPLSIQDLTNGNLNKPAHVQVDSFQQPSVESSLFLPVGSTRTHHYTARALPLLGRDKPMDVLRRFTENIPGFRWMQIAGAGGQGKSRLALELALERDKNGWSVGFLQPGELLRLSPLWAQWSPQKPTLVITDYVIGYEREMGNAMRYLASRENLGVPVRWLILERQRWDRGYLDSELAEERQEEGASDDGPRDSFAGGIADWFVRLSAQNMGDLNIDRVKFDPSVVDLKALKEEELIAIVRQWSAKRNINIDVNDRELGDTLARIDPTGRPLYAYFLAEAFAVGFPKEGWGRENLLRATLSRDQRYRWSQYFSGPPPTLDDDVPSLRLAMLATVVGSLDVSLLKERPGWSVPTSEVRRQTLALVDGPIGSDVSGPRELIPKLEPDILGGWFILDIASHGVLDAEQIFTTAWALAPKETSATLLRLAQDFPKHAKLVDLLVIDPRSQDGQQAFTDIALGLLMAIRDKARIHRIGIIPRIQSSAENGDGYAMAKLGMCYKEGIGLREPNFEKAFHWFERGALEGNGRAMAYLGHCYFSGVGVERTDFDAAFQWFNKGAETGDGHAMTYLGICYHVGIGIERNVKEAVRWFTRGATAGDGLAMVYLGLVLLEGDGVKRDPERAFDAFKKGADVGSAHAMAYLGYCYENGIGVERNIQRAVDWYEKGSDAGSGQAMANLGLCFLHGTDVNEADPIAAVELFKKGATAGSGLAMAQLGNCFSEGLGVQRDVNEGVRWWIQAAKLNDEGAIETLKLKEIPWK